MDWHPIQVILPHPMLQIHLDLDETVFIFKDEVLKISVLVLPSL